MMMNRIHRIRNISATTLSIAAEGSGRHFTTVSVDQERAISNCTALVKQHDFDSYLCGVLLPRKYRGPFFAVRAYHVELALIKDQCRKNVLSGRMRFQFWRDAVEHIYSPKDVSAMQLAAQPPVAKALECFVRDFDMPQRYFERALDARYVHAK